MKKILVLILTALVTAICLWLLRPPQKRSVLLITLESCRPDRFKCEEFHKRGVICTNAVSQVPLSRPSHASILTGLRPQRHGVRNDVGFALSDEVTTLAELFKARHYQTAAFVSGLPVISASGLNQGFDLYDDALTPPPFRPLPCRPDPGAWTSERPVAATVDAALDWIRRQKKPFFVWIHLFSPHVPYDPPAPFDVEYLLDAPYDGELVSAGVEILRLTQAMPRKALMALVGSQGESLGEHGEATHGMFLYDSTIRIPLILVAEDVLPANHVYPYQVQSIDLVPTLAHLCGWTDSISVDGEDLLPQILAGQEPPERPALLESLYGSLSFGCPELWAVRTNRWKLILSDPPELYDLIRDPGETTNRYDSEPKISQDLKAALMTLKTPGGPSSLLQTFAEQDRQALPFLFTNASTESPTPLSLSQASEVRAKLLEVDLSLVISDLDKALESLQGLLKTFGPLPGIASRLTAIYMQKEQVQACVPLLGSAIRAFPQDVDCRIQMAQVFKQTGYSKEAMDCARRAWEVDPQDGRPALVLVRLLKDAQKISDAMALCEQAVDRAPHTSSGLYNELGLFYQQAGRMEEARGRYEEGLKVDPMDAQILNNLGIVAASKGELSKAIDLLKDALRSDPSIVDARLNLADCLSAAGRTEEADEEYHIVATTYTAPLDVRKLAQKRIVRPQPTFSPPSTPVPTP